MVYNFKLNPNNIFSLYGHNDKNLVYPRDLVEKGDIIGYIGESGITDGPHLHFEMWKNTRDSLATGKQPKFNRWDGKHPVCA